MSVISILRTPRVFGIALFDMIGSILGLFLALKMVIPHKPSQFYWAWAVVLVLPLAVSVHYVLGIHTALNGYLGL